MSFPNNDELSPTALLESMLFVASGPVSTGRLAKALETTPAAVPVCCTRWKTITGSRGLRLQWSGSAVQLTTAPEASTIIERFLGLETDHTAQPGGAGSAGHCRLHAAHHPAAS